MSKIITDTNSWPSSIHPDLLAIRDLVYQPNKFIYSQPHIEPECSEYGGYVFQLNNLRVRFRVAKTTPTKMGQFVTLWKRMGTSPIQPYDISDPVDLFIISTRQGNHFGQFVFPKSVLCEHDIISTLNKGGKRAIRVYPSWDNPTSKQAKNTQNWQLKYFLEIPQHKPIDCARVQSLYSF
jgi:hypothetical protein